jgi:transposase
MTFKTIRCALTASEETRKLLWEWMEKYTLLVSELLDKIGNSPDFSTWQEKREITQDQVETVLKTLKDHPDYTGLPPRFYTSAKFITYETYKSWLALQKSRSLTLLGKIQWVQAVSSEFELIESTSFSFDEIQHQAQKILKEVMKEQQNNQQKQLIYFLLKKHKKIKDSLKLRAINHLLINNNKVSQEETDIQQLSELIERKRIEIDRLQEQLQSQKPKGRDPNKKRFLESLSQATALPAADSDIENLDDGRQQQQISLYNELFYAVKFESSGDLSWHTETESSQSAQKKNRVKKRIVVKIKGVGQYSFKIQCNRRHLPVFQQFVTDYQTHQQLSENQKFSEGLFVLRSACLIFGKTTQNRNRQTKKALKATQNVEKNQPWNTHRLYLHCTIDPHLLTSQGTEQVRLKKIQNTKKELKGKDTLTDVEVEQLDLPKNTISRIKANRTTLSRLENNPSPPRPNRPESNKKLNIALGVSFSRRQPVAVAIVDVQLAQVLEVQSTKEILNRGQTRLIYRNGKKELLTKSGLVRKHPNGGKLYTRKAGKKVRQKPSHLINKLHQQHQQKCLQRAKQQQQGNYRRDKSQSNLGTYVDRLIAARIVDLAALRNAATIVIPNLEGIRESVESEIQAQAQRQFPHDKERQKEYKKQFRQSFHNWSYGRLSQYIQECASQADIAVVIDKQSSQGSLEHKAAMIVFSAFKLNA